MTDASLNGGNVHQGVGKGEVWRADSINKWWGEVSGGNTSNPSGNETRPNTTYFNLLIYAGYPI